MLLLGPKDPHQPPFQQLDHPGYFKFKQSAHDRQGQAMPGMKVTLVCFASEAKVTK